ncbi:NAD(P)/FAD-dependent oxidoreductase [Paraliomyxa miuraensis]|uniref:NAD(P)/FAD-dependent oxidoreductase n=1 Tax=Paraliomyxa miuraensis TaxID=376150 RepID=UPI00225388F0|nr:FAD-dependent oxidoreductase [Paraliomyxa miuraensis]MCX4240398.1 NAD(P)/FAD-dependent oxidoreductase [Paraliomyxa miuraensis]
MPHRIELRAHPDVGDDDAALRRVAAAQARIPEAEVERVVVRRRSIDARRGRVHLQLVVELWRRGESIPAERRPEPVVLPSLCGEPPVVIVGAGPAGMFCAWALAQRGVRAVVLERGKSVRPRRHDLAALAKHGRLDPESNYCFGEGGAGTFSDGKLYTRAHKRGDVHRVLEAFVGYGAPQEILVDARPHIGTNRLPRVVTSMREHLASAGVELCFEHRVEGLRTEAGRVTGVRVKGEVVRARAVVLAVGHSARDVTRWSSEAGVLLSAKPFAVGVRLEHPQALIDQLQYGALAGHRALGAAAYRVVEQAAGAGAFSFCMCPGGFIVPAATEPGGQVVNGWSPSSRGGRFANSGFVTEVGPAQLAAAGLDPSDVLAGVELQRRLERAAFEAGGGAYVAPAQRVDDLVAGRTSTGALPRCSYPRGLTAAPLHELLGGLAIPLREALRRIGERMPGFVSSEAVAVGVESRTSAPVRTERDRETCESPGLRGLFPCGEGAGFAGGIMSAALDGIRVAEAVARSLG